MESCEVRVAMTTAMANSSMRRRAIRKACIFLLKQGLMVLTRRMMARRSSMVVAVTMKANHCRVDLLFPRWSLHSTATGLRHRYRSSAGR